MTDDAYERLAQRNAELEAEKTALAEELEHTQGERDGAIKRAQVAEEERDALAAYAERLPTLLDKLTHNLVQMRGCRHQYEIRGAIEVFETDIYSIREETPTTSLARLKTQWQGEVLEAVSIEPVFRGLPRHHLRERAGRIRSQAEAAREGGMSERQTGWYHVKTGVGWECARWELGRWYIAGTGHAYADASFEEIGDRIPTPDEPWQTVPVEPTLDMLLELAPATESTGVWATRYKAVLSAAPKPGGE